NAVIAIFSACQQGSKDPKAELETLKKQQQEIAIKIDSLQAQIAAADTSSKKEKPKLVSVVAVKQGVFQHYVEVQGRVDADQNVTLSAQVPGTITGILVTNGQKVKKGQVLATMDAATVQAQVDALKKNWELANLMYEKQKALWEQKIGTEIQYLQAKNQKESLEKNLDALNQQYDMTRIKSPINGTVDEVIAKIGQAVSPGIPAFRVINLSQMKVTADLAERYVGKVKIGDPVTVTFPDANKEINKKLTAVSQVINPASRSFTVDINLGNEDQAFFHPNMIAVLKIRDYSNQQALMVPVNTVQSTEEGKFVFVAASQNGKTVAQRQAISPGLTYGDQMEVMNGLKAGDRVITVGYQDLSSGQPLEIESQVAVK
ncbi:MAG: efflux RND transporter periplasmic adaptor subunit, partial [Chitinophagales bacterium]